MPEIEHGDKRVPYAGSVYTLPASYLAVSGETIEAQQHNDPLEDIAQTLNETRPIGVGGTGASTAIGGHDAFSTKGVNEASATTTDIGAATGMYVHITGTTTITGFGTKTAGVKRICVFDGILTLTHNATSLILPTGANITTAAGDVAIMVSEGSGNWKCVAYVRADGTALALPSSPTLVTPNVTTSMVITRTDNGAAGPTITTQHISADPAASDVIFDLLAQAKDSGGNTDTYGDIQHIITAPTATNEGSVWAFLTRVAGTLAERLRIGAGLYMQGATGGDPGAGKINATEVQMNGSPLDLRLGTSVTPPSAATFDFTTPISANTKQITVSFSELSLASTGVMILQMGDAGGPESSGYNGATIGAGGGGSTDTNWTSGIIIERDSNAANVVSGSVILTLIDAATNLWSISGASNRSNSGFGNFIAGSKALSATLTSIRFTTVAGTALFDNSGKANIAVQNG
jgi:hypothetical protein